MRRTTVTDGLTTTSNVDISTGTLRASMRKLSNSDEIFSDRDITSDISSGTQGKGVINFTSADLQTAGEYLVVLKHELTTGKFEYFPEDSGIRVTINAEFD